MKDKTANAYEKTITTLSNLAELALQAIYPNVCLLCGAATPTAQRALLRRNTPIRALVCQNCLERVVASSNVFCYRCGAIIRPGNYSGRCQPRCAKNFAFDRIYPMNFYRGLLRAVILRLKHENDPTLAKLFAKIYCEARAKQLEAFQPDCVVATPMNWRRRALRGGVNAPATIAKELARTLGALDMSAYLRRARATAPQTSVEWAKRAVNVSGAFELRRPIFRRAILDPFAGRRVVLVDDAFTTGATVNEIARVLRENGAQAVYVATLARAGLGLIHNS